MRAGDLVTVNCVKCNARQTHPVCATCFAIEVAMANLSERLREKRNLLHDMADGHPFGSSEQHRLRGKAEGVNLAISFVEEVIRG